MATCASKTKHLRLDWVAAPNPFGKRGLRSSLSSGYNRDKSVEYVCYGTGFTAVLAPIDQPGQPIVFSEHKSKVTCVSIAPNGAHVASGDEAGRVIVWKFDETQEIVNSFMVCEGAVSEIRWGPKSDMFVAGGASRRNYAFVYRISSQNSVGKIDKITNNVLSLDFSPSGDTVVTVDENNELNFYPKYEHSIRSKKHNRYPNVVRFKPDGSELATASSDATVILYDAKTLDVKKTYGGPECKDAHTLSIYGFAWSPCGTKFATCSADTTVKVWDAETGNVLNTWTVKNHPDALKNQQAAVVWTGSNRIISLSLSGSLNVFEESTPGTVTKYLVRPSAEFVVSFIAASKSAGKLYSCDWDGCLTETDTKTGETRWLEQRVPEGGSIVACVSCDEQSLFVGSGSTVYKLAIESKSDAPSRLEPYVSFESPVIRLASAKTSPDTIAVGLKDEKVALVKNGIVTSTVASQASDLAFNDADSELAVAVGGNDKRVVRVFSIEDGKLTHKADSGDDNGFQPDFVTYFNDWVISCQGAQLNIFKPEKFGEVANPGWVFHNSRISSGKLSPTKSHLITVGQDRQIIVWRELDKLRPRNRIISDASPSGIVKTEWISDTSFVTLDSANYIKCWTVL